MKQHTYIAIDLKSFYASVECIDRGLDPFYTPLVVADKSRGDGTIILAVSPYLKTLNIPSRLRVFELPKIDNLIFATPRMQRYLEVSAEVVKIFMEFVSFEDIYVYSIDESFIDITNYPNLKNIGAYNIAKKIFLRIKEKLKSNSIRNKSGQNKSKRRMNHAERENSCSHYVGASGIVDDFCNSVCSRNSSTGW